MVKYGLVRTTDILLFQAGLLTCGSPSAHAFPSNIRSIVTFYEHRPRLQRWPNVTDSHRIPFSLQTLQHLKKYVISNILYSIYEIM